MRFSIGMALAALIGGCVMQNPPQTTSDHAVLAHECQVRGGHLEPIPGANNPNEASNYYCDLPGGAQSH
ncbi:MAG TPA: hypothetical protein VG407_03260 [Caulobacteraceae bacterium]|jgi:hypothetical protein|nr:hypothetical protein [Caulobacteraceae bacterium]